MSSSELIGQIPVDVHMSNPDQLFLVQDHHHHHHHQHDVGDGGKRRTRRKRELAIDEFGRDGQLGVLDRRDQDDCDHSSPGLAAPSDREGREDRDSVGGRAPLDRRDHRDQDREAKKEDAPARTPREEAKTVSPSSPSAAESAGFTQPVDENDEGFRTPTSSEHKIPPMKQCPPAPRKPKPSPKRKAATPPPINTRHRSAACRSLVIEFSERDCEPMFPSARPDPDHYILKFKKPRRDDQE